MKPRRLSTARLSLSLAAALAAPSAHAATLIWDGTGSGGTGDGAGVWDTASKWWNSSIDTTWTSGFDAVFGNGGAGGAVTLNNATTVNSLTFNPFSGTYTLGTAGKTITLNNGITMNSGAGAVSIISPITLAGPSIWTNNSSSLFTVGTGAVSTGSNLLTVNGSGNTTVSSVITGSGGLTYSGSGNLTLSGANTALAGGLTVSSGTVTAGVASSAFGATSNPVTVSGGATLALSTFAETIGSLSGGGNVTLDTSTGQSLTINGTGINTTFSGNITGGKSGSQSVNCNFTGTQVFSGNNTFAGWITLSSGTLRLGSANPIGSSAGSGNLVFGTSGILQFSAANTTDYSGRIGNAQPTKLDLNGQTVSWGGYGGTSSSLTLYDTAGGGVFNLGSTTASSTGDSGTGAYTINSGTLNLKNAGSAANNTVTMNGGALSFDSAWAATYGPDIFYLGGLAASSSGTGYNIALQNSAGSPLIAVVGGNGANTTYAANLTGAGSLVKIGSGTLILSGTGSTYSGSTALTGGFLSIGSASNLSSGGGNFIFNGGALQITGTSLNTLSAITAGHTLVTNNAMPMWLDINNAANTFTVDTTLPASGLAISGAGAVAFPNSVSAVTLGAPSGASATYTGTGIGNGSSARSVTMVGPGTQVLQTSNAYAGATSLNRGTLTLSGNGSINQSSGITFNGGTLNLVNTNSTDNAVVRINTSNAVTSNGGALTVTNTSTNNLAYAEALGPVGLPSGQLDITLVNNQTGTGTSAQTLTLGGLTQSGTAAVTFSAASTGPQASGNKNMIAVTGAGTPGGIIGSWATTGTAANSQTDYAAYSANYVVPANIAATAQSGWSTDNTSGTGTLNDTTSALVSATLTATRNINSVRSTNNTVTVTASSPNITVTGHALAVGDVVTFSAATMPTGLTAGTPYYVVATGANTIQVSATSGGGAITPSTTGTTVVANSGIQVASGKNLGTTGILNGSATTLNILQSGGAGAVTLPTTSAGNLYVNAGAGNIAISAPINDNTGALTLVKTGSNTLTLSSTSSTFSGGTAINAGTLAYGADTNLGLAGSRNITFNGTGTLSPSATSSLGVLTVMDLSISTENGRKNANKAEIARNQRVMGDGPMGG